ncbi:HEAT repeat domain-containing protein, partial [uncultured Gimesia sp.]|uniref:HEAT repeat domain-containing protein n=1 Tax=uncultured Gimesia sp. TaxID=1678688 RepID=UPI002608A104
MQCKKYPILIIAPLIAALMLLPAAVSAQSQPAQTKNVTKNVKDAISGKKDSNARTRLQLLNIENRLKTLKQQPAHQPVVTQQTRAYLVVENSLKGPPTSYRTRNSTHYILTRLILVNHSPQPLKLIRSEIKAKVDGKAHPLAELPKNIGYQTVLIEKRNQRLSSLKFEDEVIIPPGKQGGLWIVISDLQAGPRVQEIEFQTTVNGQQLTLNVNRFELGKLHHSVQLMGPSRCLAELTITGELNSINIGNLMQEIDLLTTQNIKRFVIHFPTKNSLIEKAVNDWLPRAAEQIGSNTIVEPRFPAFPTLIRELHLSGNAFKDSKPRYTHTKVTHLTEEAAIHAALDSAMRVLSREKVSEQIRIGSPPVKVAALISGGRQLTNEELDLVLELTADQNPHVQEAALYALRYFGDSRAFERLTKVASQPPGSQFEMAVASLAESRFTNGQNFLLQILKQHPPESQIVIIGIISQSPRSQWGAAIYGFLSSDNQALRQAAIKALVLNGHPKLLEVLSNALKSPHEELREVAFRELIKRKDVESETLAMIYVLAKIEHAAPTTEMLSFINRIKDPRTIPLLFQQLQNSKLSSSLRVSIIKTLALIGDQTVDKQFLKFFPKANAAEKLLILDSLRKVESPHYFKLARQAIQDSNPSIVKGTISSLKYSSSNEALLILQEKLQKTKDPSTWQTIYSTLISIGTPEARRAIMQARHDGNLEEKKNAAHVALTKIYKNSPGQNYYQTGLRLQSEKKWQAAIEKYNTAISIDQLLIPAYIGLVDVNNSLRNFEEALKYADQALKIDDMNPRLYVAKGLVYSNQSNSTEALKQFNKAIEISPLDNFPYLIIASHHIKLKQYQEAIAAYDAIIQIKPNDLQPYLFKGQLLTEISQYDEALRVYDEIIRKNNRYVSAFTGRGHTNLQKTDWKAAQKDFQKAFDLNNKSSQAISGLAICMVYNHEEDKAISFVEGHVKQFEQSGLFRYNTACVYGRTLINLRDQTKTTEVKKRIKAYQEKAIQHLILSSQYGFEDVEWMQKDPDLSELQEL